MRLASSVKEHLKQQKEKEEAYEEEEEHPPKEVKVAPPLQYIQEEEEEEEETPPAPAAPKEESSLLPFRVQMLLTFVVVPVISIIMYALFMGHLEMHREATPFTYALRSNIQDPHSEAYEFDDKMLLYVLKRSFQAHIDKAPCLCMYHLDMLQDNKKICFIKDQLFINPRMIGYAKNGNILLKDGTERRRNIYLEWDDEDTQEPHWMRLNEAVSLCMQQALEEMSSL
jgi:hypothetical protein